jgi:Divergent InlB B-repeat domain
MTSVRCSRRCSRRCAYSSRSPARGRSTRPTAFLAWTTTTASEASAAATIRCPRRSPLVATGTNAVWDAALCDLPPGATAGGKPTCTVSAYSARWTRVRFDVPDFDPGVPPKVSVRFRVLKRGTGSGTVRSGSLNCGSTCAVDKDFGQPETLVAEPAPGSNFVRWQGACSTQPSCALAVGPVTVVAAVFDAVSTPNPTATMPTAQTSQTSQPSQSVSRFTARLKRIAVVGRGRRRAILIRVQVNAPASIRATLSRGRHRVASRHWRVRSGSPLLRFRVPARARGGSYRLSLSIRDAAGHGTQIKRRVRLGR